MAHNNLHEHWLYGWKDFYACGVKRSSLDLSDLEETISTRSSPDNRWVGFGTFFEIGGQPFRVGV